MLPYLFLIIIISLVIFLGLLVSIAFLTLIERRFIGSTQNRKGPNVVGYEGLLQPFADALKLIIKESIFPRNSRFIIFIVSPLISLFFALIAWAFIPFSYTAIIADVNIGLFFIFTTSILHVYGIILAGWSSGSRYSFLGALRSTAQLVAYDISIGIIICTIALYTKSLSLIDIVNFQDRYGYFAFYLPALFSLFLVSSLAETNRHPFDLPEAESELVGGYTTEYSASYFAYFFLGEYCSILLMVFLINHLFLGGWTGSSIYFISFFFYMLKLLLLYYFFLIIRAAIPRYRYDQLMRLGWKFVLPLCLSLFFLVTIIVLFTNDYYAINLPDFSPSLHFKRFYTFFFFSPDGYMITTINNRTEHTEDYKKQVFISSLMNINFFNYYEIFITTSLQGENSPIRDFLDYRKQEIIDLELPGIGIFKNNNSPKNDYYAINLPDFLPSLHFKRFYTFFFFSPDGYMITTINNTRIEHTEDYKKQVYISPSLMNINFFNYYEIFIKTSLQEENSPIRDFLDYKKREIIYLMLPGTETFKNSNLPKNDYYTINLPDFLLSLHFKRFYNFFFFSPDGYIINTINNRIEHTEDYKKQVYISPSLMNINFFNYYEIFIKTSLQEENSPIRDFLDYKKREIIYLELPGIGIFKNNNLPKND